MITTMKTLLRRFGAIILALGFAVGLSACSAVKLGYNNLPELAFWWLDGYADFTDTQEGTVKDALAQLHAWHRREELPRLAELLGRMEQLAPGPITAPQTCEIVTELQARAFAVADRAEPAVLTLATAVTTAQLQHLERKYRSSNESYRQDWIEAGPEAMQQKRFDQLVDRSETIYGRLDEAQRAVLRQGLAQSIFDPRRLLAERQRRQQDLLQTLRKVSDPALPGTEVRAAMKAFLERSVRAPDPVMRKYQEDLLQEGCRLFAAVHATTLPPQRQQAAQRLRAYQRDLRELAAQR